MNVLSFLSSEIVYSRLFRLSDGVTTLTVLDATLEVLRVM